MRYQAWGLILLAVMLAGQGGVQDAPLAVVQISYGETLVPGAAVQPAERDSSRIQGSV